MSTYKNDSRKLSYHLKLKTMIQLPIGMLHYWFDNEYTILSTIYQISSRGNIKDCMFEHFQLSWTLIVLIITLCNFFGLFSLLFLLI